MDICSHSLMGRPADQRFTVEDAARLSPDAARNLDLRMASLLAGDCTGALGALIAAEITRQLRRRKVRRAA